MENTCSITKHNRLGFIDSIVAFFKNPKTLKVLSILLFVTYSSQLYYQYAIDDTVALEGIFSPTATVLMVILRWITITMVMIGIITPFFGGKSFKNILSFIAPIIVIINFIFINANYKAYFGDGINYYHEWRSYMWIIEMTCLLFIGSGYLLDKINSKQLKLSLKDVGMIFLMLVLMMAANFYQSALHIFFGDYSEMTKEFTPIHRITMYFGVAVMIGIYGLMRNKSLEDKNLLFACLSLSALMQYFYFARLGLAALPLHLCNTAVVLMFFGFIFKIKGIFYFTYFVNVIGAFCAIILPNVTFNAFTINSVHFWYNHIYAFILPILGVALHVYKRPNLKMMRGAILIFTLYFLFAAFMNAWLNNYGSVDYFFLYSDFFVDKFSFTRTWKYNYILDIPYKDLTFTFFYVFQMAIYIGFIILMFLMWIVYDYLYKVSDLHYALRLKKKKQKMDILNLRKELNGRSISEPIDPEGVKMIKIEHFTKRYGSSNKKAVDDFSLTVNDGEVFGFLGHNGAGKSTTIKSMVGIQSITEGKIEIAGYDIAKQPLEAKLRMGYVSDNHAVYEKLTGREYINYVADLYLVSQEDRVERLNKYTKIFKLEDAIDNEIKSYSHGMKQKLVVIASLIHDPQVWILDEPLTGLDPTSSYQIKECMREHANRGNIVFFSSHVIEVVEKICDKICIISHGKLQCIYSLQELKEKNISLEQLYLQYVEQA